MGKSTLAEDFVKRHPEFVLELEPYHALQEQGGIDFKQIYREDIFGLFPGYQSEIIELWGNRKSRLARLESLLARYLISNRK